MQVCRTIAEVRFWRNNCRGTVGFVPTMGALHAGHRSLLERMRSECGHAVCSIFINPTQFGPNEDLSRYPRPLEADLTLCQSAGVDVVFLPRSEEMYPAGAVTSVDVGQLGSIFEGAIRPGHFRGVATIVLKLFSIVQPDNAYFGEKDYQQLCVIHQLVRDLNLPVRIVPCPTVREADGLALSSRNAYLTPEQRAAAPVLVRALRAMGELHLKGITAPGSLLEAARAEFGAASLPPVLDYLTIVDPDTLHEVSQAQGASRVLIAAQLGSTRLIDNIALSERAVTTGPRTTMGATA